MGRKDCIQVSGMEKTRIGVKGEGLERARKLIIARLRLFKIPAHSQIQGRLPALVPTGMRIQLGQYLSRKSQTANACVDIYLAYRTCLIVQIY